MDCFSIEGAAKIISAVAKPSKREIELEVENKQLKKEVEKWKSYTEITGIEGQEIINDYKKENEHYKHIIDELEKWLMEENNQKYSKDIWNYSVNSWVLTKLQELKGSDKE